MNYTLVVVLLIFIFAMVHGFKKGMIKEISGLISWIVTLFVMSLVIMLYTSFRANESKNMVFTIIILAAVGVVNSLIRFFLKPMKLAVKLPVLKLLNQLAGIIIGAAEGFLIVWLIYVLNESGSFGQIGEMIKEDTARSQILSAIYEYNYLIKVAAGF